MYTCGVHNREVEDDTSCPDCEVFFAAPPDVDKMTPAARAQELQMWYDNVLSIDFDLLHGRIEALVGRPVFTHELALNRDGLLAEAGGGPHPTTEEIISDLATWCEENGKPLIIAGVS